MAHEADDKRALFQRVVDDIVEQIRTGKLTGGDVLPTARKLAEVYDVASMTAQRALRELQQHGLTYAVVGKGTFVHPLAAERIRVDEHGPIEAQHQTGPYVIDDRDLNRRVAEFLLHQNEITGRFVDAMMARDRKAMNTTANELSDWKSAHAGLADDIAKWEANNGIEPPIRSLPAAKPAAKPRRPRKATS
jgi:DNA-binding transcriptional regulator YhcF (GntR family)